MPKKPEVYRLGNQQIPPREFCYSCLQWEPVSEFYEFRASQLNKDISKGILACNGCCLRLIEYYKVQLPIGGLRFPRSEFTYGPIYN